MAGASDTLARVILVAAVVLGLVVLLAVLIRLAFRRGILRPLNEAGAHFDRIADGDLTGAIALRGDNEIGVLYSAMRRMQTGLTERWPRCATASRRSIPARARSPRAAPTCPTAPRARQAPCRKPPPT